MPNYYKKPCPKCAGRVYRDSIKTDDGQPHLHRACGGGTPRGRRLPRPECRVCGDTVKERGRQYCSKECMGVGFRDNYGDTTTEKPCQVCGTVMRVQAHRLHQKKWCSIECQGVGRIKSGGTWARNRGIKISSPIAFGECLHCGKPFSSRHHATGYCSDACRYAPHLEDARTRTNELYRLASNHLQPGESARWRKVLHLLIREQDGDICAVCFDPIDFRLSGRDPRGPSVEHLIPRSKGGGDELSNLALSHWGCNRARGAKDLEDVWSVAV